MENKCYYVSSRGLLKSCDHYSNNPKSSCSTDKEYLYKMLNNMFNGMTIYVCSDLLSFFVNQILNKINKSFILVTGDLDKTIPNEALTQNQLIKLLSSFFLIKWYAQNTVYTNNKLKNLPIGLDYHTISTNPSHNWRQKNEGYLPREQEYILAHFNSTKKPFWERIPKIYVNFSKHNDRFRDRRKSIEKIPGHLLVINDIFTPRTINWNNICEYSFVLSPAGIGLDCHRTWEALCLGSIPIVNIKFNNLFDELPVLVVKDWSEINEELLIKTIENFKNCFLNMNKLSLKYWIDKIKN